MAKRASLERRLQALEREVRRLADIEEIKKLKAEYCFHADDGYDADALADLYTEDAIWDGGKLFGKYQGREAIKRFTAGISRHIVFAVHAVLTPHLEVKGDTGKGTWYLIQAATMGKDSQAVWGMAKYTEKYARVDGRWKFKHIKVAFQFFTPYEKGWAKQRFLTQDQALAGSG